MQNKAGVLLLNSRSVCLTDYSGISVDLHYASPSVIYYFIYTHTHIYLDIHYNIYTIFYSVTKVQQDTHHPKAVNCSTSYLMWENKQEKCFFTVMTRLIQIHYIPYNDFSLCQFLWDHKWALSYLHSYKDLYFDLLGIGFNRFYINCIGNW